MSNILFNPNRFFAKKKEEKVSLKIPFLIVLVNGLFLVAPNVLILNKIVETLPSDIRSFVAASFIFGIIITLFSYFLGWLILSGVLYLISCHFYSEGSFKRTVEFIGYGYIPMIFSSLAVLLILYLILPSIDISLQNPQLIQQNIEQITMNNPFIRFSQIFGIICILWSAKIWIFALLHARNMLIKNAIITVGIPMSLYLIFTIYIIFSA
jgi:hypothetical protein